VNAVGVRPFLFTAAVLGLPACGSNEKEITWKEQIRLWNHGTVVVERSQQYRGVSEPGRGAGWLFNYAKLKANLPGRSGEIAWQGAAQPLVLDLDTREQIYLVATMESSRSLREYAVPEGTWYVAFRLEGDTWTRIAIDAVPPDLRPNLLAAVHRVFLGKQAQPSGSLVTMGVKEQAHREATLPEHYRRLPSQK
jgi:hypothetical protein